MLRAGLGEPDQNVPLAEFTRNAKKTPHMFTKTEKEM